jgi:phage terminase large subunit-like protein
LLKNATKADVEEMMLDFNEQELLNLQYDWEFWARDSQLPPDTRWIIWLILAGRGWGKTRVGAEQVRRWQESGVYRMALVGQTPKEVRDVMVEGESGILEVSPPWNKPTYESSKARVTWSNGAHALIYSAENPEVLRGPQHEKAWVDELAKMKKAQETWDNLMMGLRLGEPQVVVTTTPRPTKIIKDLINLEMTHITKGSTFENEDNLADVFLTTILNKYQGTRLGRQELNAEILGDNPEALWARATLDKNRIIKLPENIKRIVVAIDPSTTNKETSDEAGIIVAGLTYENTGVILEDISIKASPKVWAEIAISAYYKWNADRIVGEANNGGDMIETILRSIDNNVSYKKVWAAKSKQTRAEPVASLYEQDKVKHVGYFEQLEDEYCEWVPGEKSPNRLDAAVWALTELMIQKNGRLLTLNRSRLGI